MAGTRVENQLRATREERFGGGRRRALAVALALLFIACIGLGSGVALWDVGGPPRLADPDAYLGDLVAVAFVCLLMTPFLVRMLRARRGRSVDDPDPDVAPVAAHWWTRVLVIVTLAGTVLAAGFAISLLPTLDLRRGNGGGQTELTAGRAEPAREPDGAAPPVHWWGYGLLALVLLAGAGTAWRLRERRPTEPLRADEDTDELIEAVDLSLDDIEHEPDPRRAVIRAYARMERALAAYGLARRPSETPFEYLGRALTSLHVGRPAVERLTALFERAKFSPHAIDLSMKAEALAALADLRAELVEGAA